MYCKAHIAGNELCGKAVFGAEVKKYALNHKVIEFKLESQA